MFGISVYNRVDIVTKPIIEHFIKLWQLKAFTLFVQPPSILSQCDAIKLPDNQIDIASNIVQSKKSKPYDTNYLFSYILSAVNVWVQQHKHRIHFEKLADLITALIKNRLMTLAFLNEQCMKLLHLEWEKVNNI